MLNSIDNLGHLQEAEDILLKCFRVDPSSSEVTRLGSYYLQYQRFNEAEKFFSITMSLDGRNWKALAELGKIYLIRDDDKVEHDYIFKKRQILNPMMRIFSLSWP